MGQSKTTTYLPSKPRYEILDGLRGVAAMFVVIYHLLEAVFGTSCCHGYLAVDFFFVLSGFVVGYAYDDRWDRMSYWDFFKRRLTRLHPMLVFGTVFGALYFYLGASPVSPLVDQTPWWKTLVAMLLCCCMIPAGKTFDIRGWNDTNPFNGPAWTLLWEYIANIVYAFILRRLPKIVLGILVILAGFLTLNLTLDLDVFGNLGNRGRFAFTVIGGWNTTPAETFVAITRLAFPFLSGLLVSRLHKFIDIKGGFWICSILVVLALMIPHIPGIGNGIYESVCILVLFPLIVAIGAGSSITGDKSLKTCRFLGDISYPLYITHHIYIYPLMGQMATHQYSPGALAFMCTGVFILSIATAYAALKLYDIPVRTWLRDHWLKRGKVAQ